MSHDTFLYVTYIASTPSKVWQALIEGEITRQYWGHENIAPDGWQVGNPWQHVGGDEHRTVKVVGTVVECLPDRRLSLTWVDPGNVADSSKHSLVTLDIEPYDDMVRLTVTHERLYPEMAKKITYGWPLVMASLKSMLETGHPLRIFG